MVKAFVLIECEVNSVLPTIDALEDLDEVREASAVTGKYDVIAEIEVEEVQDLRDIVTGTVHGIPGVETTTTCIST